MNEQDPEMELAKGDQNGDIHKKPLLASGLMESPMDRIKMKAKRNIKAIAKDVPNGATGVIQTARKWKNSRRPRNGYRPKKDRKGRRPVQDTYQLFF